MSKGHKGVIALQEPITRSQLDLKALLLAVLLELDLILHIWRHHAATKNAPQALPSKLSSPGLALLSPYPASNKSCGNVGQKKSVREVRSENVSLHPLEISRTSTA